MYPNPGINFMVLVLLNMSFTVCCGNNNSLLLKAVCEAVHHCETDFGDIQTIYLSENNDFYLTHQNASRLFDELKKGKFFYPDVDLYYQWAKEDRPEFLVNNIRLESCICESYVFKPFIWSSNSAQDENRSEKCIWVLRSNVAESENCSYVLFGIYKTAVKLDESGKVTDYLKHVPGMIPDYFVLLRIAGSSGAIECVPIGAPDVIQK